MTTVRKPSASISSTSQSIAAVTVAVRASPVSSDISPNTSPARSRATSPLGAGERHRRLAAKDDEQRLAGLPLSNNRFSRGVLHRPRDARAAPRALRPRAARTTGPTRGRPAPTVLRTGTTPPSSARHLHLNRVRNGDVVALERVVDVRPHLILRATRPGSKSLDPEPHAIHDRRRAEVGDPHFGWRWPSKARSAFLQRLAR